MRRTVAGSAQPMAIVDVEHLGGTYFFRYDEFGADAYAETHSHSWGHLNYAAHGTMELEVPGARFLTPPQQAVWVPPGVPHSSTLRHAIQYRALYIAPALYEAGLTL